MSEVVVPRLPVEVIDPIAMVTGWLKSRGEVERRFAQVVRGNPLEALAVLLIATSSAFLYAERPANPKVKTFWDALYYISTCLSVGYADIWPVTTMGRNVSTIVMTFGPSLAAMAFERPDLPPIGTEAEPRADMTPLLEKMDAMLSELQRLNVNLTGA